MTMEQEKAGKVFPETVINRAINPRSRGTMQDGNDFARVTGPFGDTMDA